MAAASASKGLADLLAPFANAITYHVHGSLGRAARISLVSGDITRFTGDAIVNAANERMLGGGGVDGAIHRAAGPELRQLCLRVPEVGRGVRCPTGEARITGSGSRLPAKMVIHTVGPIYSDPFGSRKKLTSAYSASMKLANEHGLQTVAFPAVSCGVFGYPLLEGGKVAIDTCIREMGSSVQDVVFVLFGDDTYQAFRQAAELHPDLATSEVPEQARRESFDTKGFICVRGLLGHDEIEKSLAAVQEVLNMRNELPVEHFFFDVKDAPESLKQIQQLHKHSAQLAELARAKVEPLAREALGKDVVLKNMQFFNKPPGTSKPTPAHQDGFYFMIQPMEAATFWLALDPADEYNGAVVYGVGSHRHGMRPHEPSGVLGFSQKCLDYGTPADRAVEQVMDAAPGDIIGHHALLLHRAGANITRDRQRRALGFIYYSVDAVVDEEAHAAYQKQLKEVLQREGKL